MWAFTLNCSSLLQYCSKSRICIQLVKNSKPKPFEQLHLTDFVTPVLLSRDHEVEMNIVSLVGQVLLCGLIAIHILATQRIKIYQLATCLY